VVVGTNEPTARRMFKPNPGAPHRVNLSNARGIVTKRCSARSAEKDGRQGGMLSLASGLVNVEAHPPRPPCFVVRIRAGHDDGESREWDCASFAIENPPGQRKVTIAVRRSGGRRPAPALPPARTNRVAVTRLEIRTRNPPVTHRSSLANRFPLTARRPGHSATVTGGCPQRVPWTGHFEGRWKLARTGHRISLLKSEGRSQKEDPSVLTDAQ